VSDRELVQERKLIVIQKEYTTDHSVEPAEPAEPAEHPTEDLEAQDEKVTLEETTESATTDTSPNEWPARSHNLESWQWQMELELLALYGSVTGGFRCAHARWGWGKVPDATWTVQGAMTTEDVLVIMLMASYARYHMAWWVAQRRARAELRLARDNAMV
jgi:hypothetical protein